MTNTGAGYTSAVATVIPAASDTTGINGLLVANLEGQYGTLRTYYSDQVHGKVIVDSNAGTIDYNKGIITLTSLTPIQINNPLGQLTITAQPTTTIISSSYNRIITIDPYDPVSVVVNVTAKRS